MVLNRCDLSTGRGALGGRDVGRVLKDLEGLDWRQAGSEKLHTERGNQGLFRDSARGSLEYGGAAQGWEWGWALRAAVTGVSCCEQSGLWLLSVTRVMEKGAELALSTGTRVPTLCALFGTLLCSGCFWGLCRPVDAEPWGLGWIQPAARGVMAGEGGVMAGEARRSAAHPQSPLSGSRVW